MLTNPAQVRGEGNLPDTIVDDKLDPHIAKAMIEVRKILTPDVYTEIEGKPDNDQGRTECSIAEANLALVYAIPSLNIETQGSGIVRSKGWDQSRSDLLSQNEINALCDRYREIAMNLLSPYIPVTISTNILEFNSIADFPVLGTSNKEYIALDTGVRYIWDGSAYALKVTDEVRGANYRLSAL